MYQFGIHKLYRWVPLYCQTEDCHHYLGGSFKPKEKFLDAYLLTTSIASVRKNVAGAAVRVFVNLQKNKVSQYIHIIAFWDKIHLFILKQAI